jgi:hypothetical protein
MFAVYAADSLVEVQNIAWHCVEVESMDCKTEIPHAAVTPSVCRQKRAIESTMRMGCTLGLGLGLGLRLGLGLGLGLGSE